MSTTGAATLQHACTLEMIENAVCSMGPISAECLLRCNHPCWICLSQLDEDSVDSTLVCISDFLIWPASTMMKVISYETHKHIHRVERIQDFVLPTQTGHDILMREKTTQALSLECCLDFRYLATVSGTMPTGKTFHAWDQTVSSIPAPTQRALRTLEWIDRCENLVVCGPSGTGKTHFCEALGQAAVDAGHKITWFSLEHLAALVRRHSADDTAAKAIRRIMRADVIVIDDIGLLPVTTDTAEALYRVVDAAYEKRSIALSSNLHPAGFDELMPKTIANATVDRLLHHAHIVLTAGDSIRLTQATAGKGVTPLTN